MTSNKYYWVPDEESGDNCPICDKKFEANFLEGSVSGKTHCRRCGGVYCFSCCKEKYLIPENEIVKPPASETLNSLRFDKMDKQKACINCAKSLEPRQDAIRATFATTVKQPSLSDMSSLFGSNSSTVVTPVTDAVSPSMISTSAAAAMALTPAVAATSTSSAKPAAAAPKVAEPFFAVKVMKATGLPVKAGTTGMHCQLTVGSASLITEQCKPSTSSASWGNVLQFHVDEPNGNMLRLVLYAEEPSGKVAIGETLMVLAETPVSGQIVTLQTTPSSDAKHSAVGEVTLVMSYHGSKQQGTAQQRQVTAISAKTTSNKSAAKPAPSAASTTAASRKVPQSAPSASGPLGFLLENGWLIYLVFIIAALVYKFTSLDEFTGETLIVRPGVTISNGKFISSSTHILLMQKDGNLILSTGTSPEDVDVGGIEWQSGKPYADKDCHKCVATFDKAGVLSVKEGKTVHKQFVVAEDPWLNAAISVGR